MSRWRDGTGGAFRMGLVHGVHCVGCCWALMLLLFAGGVMNLEVIAALTAFVPFEKLAPFGPSASASAALPDRPRRLGPGPIVRLVRSFSAPHLRTVHPVHRHRHLVAPVAPSAPVAPIAS